jgi:cytochrome c2
MKKLLKIIRNLVIAILIIGLSAFLFINIRGIPSYEVEKIEFTLNSTPESIVRGKKLAQMLCINCHQNPETKLLTGNLMPDAPKEFGKIYSQNITQDDEHGIGLWTDAELVYLLRTGIKKDGQYSPPYMAKLPKMADEDINAIISFLRSDDPMVAAQNVEDYPCEPSFLTKFLSTVAFKPFNMPTEAIPMPDTSNAVELGKYLVQNLDCYTCHSADFKTNDYLEPELSVGYCGGGNKPLNREGEVVLSKNITPDVETGIGSWSKEKFVKALKSGIKEGEPALRFPMVPYLLLTDQEAGAIYEYLQTIPPINNKIE